MTRVDWSRLAVDYQEAVHVLLEDKTWKRMFTVIPCIYLYRHYMELSLKQIIQNSWDFLGLAKSFPRGHDIVKLWSICRGCLEQIDELVAPTHVKSKEYIEKVIGAYNAMDADLSVFAAFDPDSQHSRYPVDSRGNPIVVNNKALARLQGELPELVKRISYDLDGINHGLSMILRERNDGLAQQ